MKFVHTYGKYSPGGEKQPLEEITSAWDGATSVDFSRALAGAERSGAVITATRPMHDHIARNPLWSFGGRFLAALDKAVQDGETIDIRQTADGLWQIRFAGREPVHGGARWTWSGTVDRSRGFSVPQWGYTADDGTRSHFSATFTEVTDSIWFPTEGRIESLFSDDMRASLTSVKITRVVVNDPNFSANLFHVDLPKGTYVQDTVMGIAFFVGDPTSTRVLGDAMTTAHIITKGVGPNDPPAEEIFFLPHVKQALEKGTPFVLNLRTRKLVGVDAASGSQETLNSLHSSGIGDLFWDGGIVAVADTKIELVLGERTKSLPRRKMEYGARYRLPERVELPCVLQVTDRTKSRYRMVIKEVSEKGISIAYRALPGR